MDPQLSNALRILSLDAVQKANSGHPGMPLGMSDIMAVLYLQFLRHNPKNPNWPNRDRFVLSNGHGSMLHYAALHLSGYELSIEDLKQFRQLHSKTPGHPEWGITLGVETSTGPLGQGIANAVGMALAEKTLAAQFNRPSYTLVDHYTYVFLGDGCLMEGISHEACSLAGTLGLGKLIAFWDDNGISIDGQVVHWWKDHTPQRFEAYGWHVISAIDGHHPESIAAAIQNAQAVIDKPSLLCCQTQIGFGSPNLAGSHKIHGAPLEASEAVHVRKQLHWPHPPFIIPDTIYQSWDARLQGQLWEAHWLQTFKEYQKIYPELACEWTRRIQGTLPNHWPEKSQAIIQKMAACTKPNTTRKSSQQVLNELGKILPELLGGSADLSESNATAWQGCSILNARADGNYLHYGVRELGMVAIMNGLSLHGGFIPYGGTFLVFSDYARPAVRLTALMKLRVIFIFSHDSIGLGEDGPTHQPIEQLSSLRLIPNLQVWRPCDALETAVAWQQALIHMQGPSCLVLTRQNVPQQSHTTLQEKEIAKGGYILLDSSGPPQLILIATGSEVSLAISASRQLLAAGLAIRVVSIPCIERFEAQDATYQETVLPKAVTQRIAIEAGVPEIWQRYVGPQGRIIGLNRFGASAPGSHLFTYMGMTVDNILNSIQECLGVESNLKIP